jgi:hypothetical protein
MKFRGLTVPRTGSKVNVSALYTAWFERDCETQDERWKSYKEDFDAMMAERGAWLPYVEHSVLAFYVNTLAYRTAEISGSTVASMVANNMILAQLATIDAQRALVEIIGEFLKDNTGTPGSDTMFWQKNQKGKGSELRLAPTWSKLGADSKLGIAFGEATAVLTAIADEQRAAAEAAAAEAAAAAPQG